MTRLKNKKSSLLLSLALLAFLVRSMIPVGFMPGHSANNTYPLVICSGSGPVTINVTADKLPTDPHAPHSHDNMPCPFSQSLAQGIPADYSALPYVFPVSESVLIHAEVSLSLNVLVKNYFSHGPPAFPA